MRKKTKVWIKLGMHVQNILRLKKLIIQLFQVKFNSWSKYENVNLFQKTF